jgi:hypothetical protein
MGRATLIAVACAVLAPRSATAQPAGASFCPARLQLEGERAAPEAALQQALRDGGLEDAGPAGRLVVRVRGTATDFDSSSYYAFEVCLRAEWGPPEGRGPWAYLTGPTCARTPRADVSKDVAHAAALASWRQAHASAFARSLSQALSRLPCPPATVLAPVAMPVTPVTTAGASSKRADGGSGGEPPRHRSLAWYSWLLLPVSLGLVPITWILARRRRRPSVFICYAHKDNEDKDLQRRWADRVRGLLESQEQFDSLTVWWDRDISAGDDWEKRILRALGRTSAAVLLVSPHFLQSKFIVEQELPALFRGRHERKVVLIPLVVSQCSVDQPVAFESEGRRQEGRLQALQWAHAAETSLSEMGPLEVEETFRRLLKGLASLVAPRDPRGT